MFAIAFALWPAIDAAAAPGAFTDSAAFTASLADGTASVDFESLADGTLVSGSTQTAGEVGIILPNPLADVLDAGGPPLPLRIVADGGDNPASTGTNTLGVEDAENFHAITVGTPLAFGFDAPVLAFGLTIITPEEPGGALFDDDLRLFVAAEATASLSLADGQLLGSFGGREYRAYFLGVIAAAPFSTATLEIGGASLDSAFLFNLDDLVVPVPEPASGASLLVGAAVLVLMRRKRAASKGPPCC